MQSYQIIWKILYVFWGWVSIAGSYYFSKQYILSGRIKKDDKADWFEKGMTFSGVALICLLVAAFAADISDRKHFMTTTTAYSVVLLISSFAGVWKGYEADEKRTPEEKLMKRIKEKESEFTDPW